MTIINRIEFHHDRRPHISVMVWPESIVKGREWPREVFLDGETIIGGDTKLEFRD